MNWSTILPGGSLPGENTPGFTSMLLVPLTKQVIPQYSVINSDKHASVHSESHLVFLWMLVILLIVFHSAAASIYNVNAAGISPNNMIKFYDTICHIQGQWVKECYIETVKIVLHAACQCKQVNRTSGSLEQRVLRGVLLICCSPDTPTNPTPRTAFFYVDCSFGNFASLTMLLNIISSFTMPGILCSIR